MKMNLTRHQKSFDLEDQSINLISCVLMFDSRAKCQFTFESKIVNRLGCYRKKVKNKTPTYNHSPYTAVHRDLTAPVSDGVKCWEVLQVCNTEYICYSIPLRDPTSAVQPPSVTFQPESYTGTTER